MVVSESDVCEAGLYPYLDHHLTEYPEDLHQYCGQGVGIWQYPCQLAPYLNFITDKDNLNGNTIKTYAEVGTGAGGTFIFTCDFLRKRHGLDKAYAVDLADAGRVLRGGGIYNPFDANLEVYIYRNKNCCKFIKGSSIFLKEELIRKNQQLDLVFIDTDHTYDCIKRDFNVLRDSAMVIAIGGLMEPGVKMFWDELKNKGEYECTEFSQQYSGKGMGFGFFKHFGIGVIRTKRP